MTLTKRNFLPTDERWVARSKHTAAQHNNVVDRAQTEIERRGGMEFTVYTAPSMSTDALNDRIEVTGINVDVRGVSYTGSAYCSFVAIVADGHYYIQLDANGDLHPHEVEDAEMLTIGETDYSNTPLFTNTEVTVEVGKYFVALHGVTLGWDAVTGKPASFTPSAHASTHGAGQADEVTPAAIGAIPASEKGAANGVGELGADGKLLSSQMPAGIDEILEYADLASFPATGEASVIYVALDTNLCYRWSGSAYTEISPSLALGSTSDTAHRGDHGATAYAHSQATGNPHGTTAEDLDTSTYFRDPVLAMQDAPPGSWSDGERYIVGSTPSGDWVGHPLEIAVGSGGGTTWTFVVPLAGYVLMDQGTGNLKKYHGGTWANIAGTGTGIDILTGAGAPDNGDGNDGDWYLRTSNGAWYEKAAGSWGVVYTPSAGSASAYYPDPVLAMQTDPPASWSDGDRYLTTFAPSGAWSGHPLEIAVGSGGGTTWDFTAVPVGGRVPVVNAGTCSYVIRKITSVSAVYEMNSNGGQFYGAVTVPTPTLSGHAATKGYVDSVASGAANNIYEQARDLGITFNGTEVPYYQWADSDYISWAWGPLHLDGDGYFLWVPVITAAGGLAFDVMDAGTMTRVQRYTVSSGAYHNEAVRWEGYLYYFRNNGAGSIRLMKMAMADGTESDLGQVDTSINSSHGLHISPTYIWIYTYNQGAKKLEIATDTITSATYGMYGVSTYDGTNLWVSGYYGELSQRDPATFAELASHATGANQMKPCVHAGYVYAGNLGKYDPAGISSGPLTTYSPSAQPDVLLPYGKDIWLGMNAFGSHAMYPLDTSLDGIGFMGRTYAYGGGGLWGRYVARTANSLLSLAYTDGSVYRMRLERAWMQ